MPKTSAIERNKKRKRLVEKFKAKRAELKAILANPKTADVDFFAAQKKMAKLPRNSSRVRIRNRCALSGRPRAYIGRFGVSRITFRELALAGKIPGVTKSPGDPLCRREWDMTRLAPSTTSNMTDPISDFLTRLRNASKARRDECSAPFSKVKEGLAAILKSEGYISDYSTGSDDAGHQTLVAKMKYVDSAPAITGIRRMSTPGRRLYCGTARSPGPQWPRHLDSFHFQGPLEGPGLPPWQTRRRANLQHLVRRPSAMSRIGKQPVPIPDKVKVDVQDHSIKVEGPKGKVSKTFADVVKLSVNDKREIIVTPLVDSRFANAMYGTARSIINSMIKGPPWASRRTSKSRASASRPWPRASRSSFRSVTRTRSCSTFRRASR